MLDIMVSTIEAGETRTPVEIESTVQVTPALAEDWDPRAATLV